MRAHRLFGINLSSELPFTIPLGGGHDRGLAPDLTFSLLSHAPVPPLWQESSPIYRSPWRTESGESASLLYRGPGLEVLQIPGAFDFYLWPDRIVCHLREPVFRHLVEIYLLGPVLAYWLERRRIPVLHASAVAIGGRSAAFVALEGTGKSGIAAALLQRGAALLCDDIVPITEEDDGAFSAQPGFPQMRMWPDEAAYFLGRYDHLPQVCPESAKLWIPAGPGGLGTFQSSPSPLACIYLLDRSLQGEAGIGIQDLSQRDALIELLRHSFASLVVEAAGLQPFRFDLFARLVRKIPVRRLSYPSGFDRLPEVAEAVLRDLEC